jgi:hypothetical protein
MPNLQDYCNKISTFTAEQLIENLHNIHDDYDHSCQLDGSGELGPTIWKSYQPYLEALESEFTKRGIDPNQTEENDYEENDYEDLDLPF